MSLPVVDGAGCLDYRDEPYPATLMELHERFVEGAPHRRDRERIFSAIRIQSELLAELAGPSKIWVGGDLLRHGSERPGWATVVYHCRDLDHMGAILENGQILHLLSIERGFTSWPLTTGFAALRAVGGLVDAYLTIPEDRPYYRTICSQGSSDGLRDLNRRQGYVEVIV